MANLQSNNVHMLSAVIVSQVERLTKRDKCSRSQAEVKVKAQMPLHIKQDKSQIVIDNSGDRNHCKQQVTGTSHPYTRICIVECHRDIDTQIPLHNCVLQDPSMFSKVLPTSLTCVLLYHFKFLTTALLLSHGQS